MILHFQYYDTILRKNYSDVYVDWDTKTVTVDNHDDDSLYCPFGVKQSPTFEDFAYYLTTRCVPSTRSEIGVYLKSIGLDHYDPLKIVLITDGYMWEDRCVFRYMGDKNEIAHLSLL